jgi:hypothetical protein
MLLLYLSSLLTVSLFELMLPVFKSYVGNYAMRDRHDLLARQHTPQVMSLIRNAMSRDSAFSSRVPK